MRCFSPFIGFCLWLSILLFSQGFAQQTQLLLPYGHTVKVNSITYSDDDAFILTSAHDSTAGLWHVSSGKLVWFGQRIIDAQFLGNENKLLIREKGIGVSILDLKNLQTTLIQGSKDDQIQSFCLFNKRGTVAFRNSDHSIIMADTVPWSNKKPFLQLRYRSVQLENIGSEGSKISLTPEGYLTELDIDGKLTYIFPSTGNPIQSFRIFGDQILARDQEGNVILFKSSRTDKPISISGTYSPAVFKKFEVLNERLWLISGNTVLIYSTVSGERLKTSSLNKQFSGYLPKSDSIAYAFDTDSLYKISDEGSILGSFHFADRINSISVNSDRSLLSVGHFNGSISLFDTRYNTVQRTLKKHTTKLQFIGKTHDNGDFIIGISPDKKIIWNIKGIRPLSNQNEPEPESSTIKCEKYYINSEICNDTLSIISAETNKVVHSELKHGAYSSAFLSPTCSKVATFLGDHSIKLVDLNDSALTILKGHTAAVNHVEFFPEQNRLLSISDDETFKIWNLTSGELLITGLILDAENYIQYTSEFFYSGTKSAVVSLGWKNGVQIFSFDQFDLQKNRPDLVLEKLENDDEDLIKAYHLAFLKRLKRMKVEVQSIDSHTEIPTIRISNKNKIPLATPDQEIVLAISASAPSEKLSSIHVIINEVPIFGEKGIDLSTKSESNVNMEIPIVLSSGNNKIEVLIVTESGMTSLKDQLWIQKIVFDRSAPQTHFIAFSVDQFMEPGHDLSYAVKDGRDMASVLKKIKNASIDTFFNLNATRDQFISIKKKLMQTKVDDEVILFLSGHGVLDTNYNFFFASYDTEFERPTSKAISLEDIHFLLDGIPARKKLILLDACHSGEIDKTELVISQLKNEEQLSKKKQGVKGATAQNNSEVRLTDSFILMQESFIELNKNSGTTFVSASAGNGYAYESEEWNNGVFSYCLLDGLLNFKADLNGNGIVTTHELKRYVIREVGNLTKGLQVPTCREEINEFDWILRK